MPIPFAKHTFSNGLRLIIHPDHTTPLVACNIVYGVGSRDEDPQHTGMAHLFEHFMFCGSKHAAHYDQYLQKIGAVNNAYTSQDVTHYYVTAPATNLETVLWLESDRMLSLAFDEQQLQIQKQVVIEEFKENYLNRPFGDLWSKFNHLVYKKHPYRWLPIGRNIAQIEAVDMDLVKSFFFKYYRPNNAVMAISGNVDPDEVIRLVEKWFGDIPAGETLLKNYPAEKHQRKSRFKNYTGKYPHDLLVKGWLTSARNDQDFHTFDLISDLFGAGRSSYLYKEFVVKKRLFTNISCHLSATFDPGYFVILATPADHFPVEEANQILNDYLYHFNYDDTLTHNLNKVKHKVESVLLNNEIRIEDRSAMLAMMEILSGAEDIENERDKYFNVSEKSIQQVTKSLFREEKSNTVIFKH